MKIKTSKQINKITETDKNLFFACLAHDLKTSVSAQLGILNMLLKNCFGKLTPKQKTIVAEMKKSNEYLLNLTLNVLHSHLYENNQIILSKKQFSFLNLINDIINELSPLFTEKEQKVFADLKSDYIFADELELRRAVVNLIGNAIVYSQKGSSIRIKSEVDNEKFIFSIENKSSYLLPENMEEFFNKFKKKYPNGSGLGLYIVKQIILAHGGNVFAGHNGDNTCHFGFWLPFSE